jgi:hypothetical protein
MLGIAVRNTKYIKAASILGHDALSTGIEVLSALL